MKKNESGGDSENHYEEGIELTKLIEIIWNGRFVVISAVLLSAALSVLYAVNLPNRYTSETIVVPRSVSGSGAAAQIASQYGGLASLAGVNLNGLSDSGSTEIALKMLGTRHFFETYLYEEMLVNMMAAKEWNSGNDQIILDEEIFDPVRGVWVEESGNDAGKPSVQEAHRVFAGDVLRVEQDSETGFVLISVTHLSPSVAKNWVSLIVRSINEAVRSRDVSVAQKSIDFLEAQREKTNILSLAAVFAGLIEQQLEIVMLASATDEYVFQTIEPPVIPELKSEPSRALICVLAVILGGFAAGFYLLARHFLFSDEDHNGH